MRQPKQAMVGGFILGALVLAAAAIVFFGRAHLFEKTSLIVVYFGDSVAGLTVGAPVTFHGVQIGSVERIAIQFSADTLKARIPVYLELSSDAITWQGRKLDTGSADYTRLVRAGLRAQLAQQSLVTGQLRVDLNFLPGTPANLVGAVPQLPEIPAVPSQLTELQSQLAQLPVLIAGVQRAFASIERLSDHFDTELGPLTQSVRRTSDAATQTLQTTDDSLRRVRAEASRTLDNVNATLVAAREQIDQRGGQLGQILADADGIARSAQALLDSVSSMTDPRSPMRGDLEAATRDLAATTSSLREFAATIDRNPSVLLRGRKTQQ